MPRLLIALLALAAAAVAGGLAIPAAHAEPLGLVAVREPAIFFREPLSLDQITRLQIEFGRTFRERAAEMPGWQCVGGGLTQEPRAVLSFDAAGSIIDERDGYALAMKLTVKGMGTREAGLIVLDWSDPEVRAVTGSQDPIDALMMVGRATINDLLKQITPCAFSLDFRLEGRTTISDAWFAYTYSGVARGVTLDADGRVTFSIPLDVTVDVTNACGSMTLQVNGARLDGRVEARDGGLRFSRLEVRHQSISGTQQCQGATCTYTDTGIGRGQCVWPGGSIVATERLNQPYTTSFGLFIGRGADIAADTILTMPLENAAELPLPSIVQLSPRTSGWRGSVVLDYSGR